MNNVLDIEGHLLQKVAVIVKSGTFCIDGVMHICTTNDALHKCLTEGESRYVGGNYVQDYMGRALGIAQVNDGIERICVYADKDVVVEISKEELNALAEPCKLIRCMLACVEGRTTLADAVEVLAQGTLYYIGNEPEAGNVIKPSDTVRGLTTHNIRRGDKQIECVATYVTRRNAEVRALNMGKQGVPVTAMKIGSIARLWNYGMPIVIEPGSDAEVTLSGETILNGEIGLKGAE